MGIGFGKVVRFWSQITGSFILPYFDSIPILATNIVSVIGGRKRKRKKKKEPYLDRELRRLARLLPLIFK